MHEGIIFAAFIRFKSGKISLGAQMVVNSLVLTLAAIVWLLLAYLPIDFGYNETGIKNQEA